MNLRNILFGLAMASALIFSVGCRKSNSEPPATLAPSKLSPDTVARIYWTGKNHLGDLASAFYFMRVWGLSQSAQLEVQTLKKLSAVPMNLGLQPDNHTNETGPLLYPLWADVVWNESYFESREPAGGPAESVLAVHLDDAHDLLWRTNLAEVIQILTGTRPVASPDGWSFQETEPSRYFQLLRIGQWTLLSVGPPKSKLFDETVARLRQDHTPYVPRHAGDWLEADADLSRFQNLFPSESASNLPELSLSITGDGAHVLSHAELSFPRPLNLDLKPWNIPARIIRQPLISFTAARGFQSALASWKPWDDLEMGPPPDQICLWTRPFGMVQTYFAASLPDARNQIDKLSTHLLGAVNPWLAGHGYLGFDAEPDNNGVTWGNSPAVKPFVKSVDAGNAGVVAYGGLMPETDADAQTNLFYDHPTFPESLHQISTSTNLLYYDWELTRYRMESSMYIGQLISILARRLPLPMDSVSAVWLKTVTPRLGNCTTTITLTAPNQLELTRSSTLGLTAAELNLLANWLESPQFPSGLYSTRTPVPNQP